MPASTKLTKASIDVRVAGDRPLSYKLLPARTVDEGKITAKFVAAKQTHARDTHTVIKDPVCSEIGR